MTDCSLQQPLFGHMKTPSSLTCAKAVLRPRSVRKTRIGVAVEQCLGSKSIKCSSTFGPASDPSFGDVADHHDRHVPRFGREARQVFRRFADLAGDAGPATTGMSATCITCGWESITTSLRRSSAISRSARCRYIFRLAVGRPRFAQRASPPAVAIFPLVTG